MQRTFALNGASELVVPALGDVLALCIALALRMKAGADLLLLLCASWVEVGWGVSCVGFASACACVCLNVRFASCAALVVALSLLASL